MVNFTDNNQILIEIKKGNSDAFEFFFKAYYPRLLGYAIRFVPNEEQSRDIVQDCFVTFWEKREEINSISITSLLFTMVKNSCLNYLKHEIVVQKHQLQYLDNLAGEERLYHSDFLIHTEGRLLFDELQEQIQKVTDSLPARCREVFLLSRFKGLKNREIADDLKISTTAVEKHISKAMTIFKKHFKDKYPTDIFIFIMIWLGEY